MRGGNPDPFRRRRIVATGLIALVFYGYAWAVTPNRPQLGAVFDDPGVLLTVHEYGFTPEDAADPQAGYQTGRFGWYGAWYDQFHYARMARALGRFELPGTKWDHEADAPERPPDRGDEVSSFSYGLGYPAIGALFFVAGFKGDPFVVPNGMLFALSAMLALVLAERVLRPWTAMVVVNGLVLTAPLVLYFVIPYGNALMVTTVLGALVVVTGARFDWPVAIALAAGVAFTFAARYVDVLWLGLLLVPLLTRWRAAWRVIVAVGVATIVAAGIVGWAHARVFGDPFTTPYEFVHDGHDASWDAYDVGEIPDAGVGVFVTGDRSVMPRVEPILRGFPWMVLAPVGLVLLFRRKDPLRLYFLLATGVGLAATTSYLAWTFGGTKDLVYWIIRFHTPWFALWAILSGVAIERMLAAVTASDSPAQAAGPNTDPESCGRWRAGRRSRTSEVPESV